MTEFLYLQAPAVYDTAASQTFVRKTGTNEFDYHRILPDRPGAEALNAGGGSANGSGQVIQFRDILTSDWNHVQEAQLLVRGRAVTRAVDVVGNLVTLPATVAAGFLPEALFRTGRFKIGSTELRTGAKDNLHIGAYVKKMIEYTPEHAKAIGLYEMFYPDGGIDARPNKVPLVGRGNVVTATTAAIPEASGGVAGNNNNVLLVGVEGVTTTPQRGEGREITLSTTPFGNPRLTFEENELYNPGFAKRHKLFTGVATSRTFVIRLKDYFDVLETFSDLKKGMQLELSLTRNDDDQCFHCAGDVTGSNPKFWIESIELQIPVYKPNPIYEQMLNQKLLDNTVTRRKWIDKDIIDHQTLHLNTTTRTVVEFTSALDRRPVGALLGFQYIAETAGNGAYNTYNGNCFRFINPVVTDAKAYIGNMMIFPNNGIKGQAGNTVELYREFLRLTEYINQNKIAPVLDYETFINHKFFVPFDFRDMDESRWATENTYKLRFEVSHGALKAEVDIDDRRNSGEPLGGQYRTILILFTEKEVVIRESQTGVAVEYNVPPLN